MCALDQTTSETNVHIKPPATAGELYAHCQVATCPGRGWFTRDDRRFHFSVYYFYKLLVQNPIKFTRFHWLWYTIYRPWWAVPFLFLSYPFSPFLLYLRWVAIHLRDRALGPPEIPVKGSPFFEAPKDLSNQVNSESYIELIERIGSYMQFGTNRDGLESTKIDTITCKEYWLDLLDAVGARRPQQLGTWSDGKVHDAGPGLKSGNCNVVCKVSDACMGIGDHLFARHVDFDFGEVDAAVSLTNILSEDSRYVGKRAIMTELMQPVKPATVKLSNDGFSNVHSLDIVTIRDARGVVKVLACTLWTDCTEWTSHTCSSGYIVDVVTEQIARPVPWYAYAFAKKDAQAAASPLIGTKIPGLHAALHKAIAAHGKSQLPWLTSVGWDLMITDDGPVFFEGNVGSMRTPRRIFLDEKTPAMWLKEIGEK